MRDGASPAAISMVQMGWDGFFVDANGVGICGIPGRDVTYPALMCEITLLVLIAIVVIPMIILFTFRAGIVNNRALIVITVIIIGFIISL